MLSRTGRAPAEYLPVPRCVRAGSNADRTRGARIRAAALPRPIYRITCPSRARLHARSQVRAKHRGAMYRVIGHYPVALPVHVGLAARSAAAQISICGRSPLRRAASHQPRPGPDHRPWKPAVRPGPHLGPAMPAVGGHCSFNLTGRRWSIHRQRRRCDYFGECRGPSGRRVRSGGRDHAGRRRGRPTRRLV